MYVAKVWMDEKVLHENVLEHFVALDALDSGLIVVLFPENVFAFFSFSSCPAIVAPVLVHVLLLPLLPPFLLPRSFEVDGPLWAQQEL